MCGVRCSVRNTSSVTMSRDRGSFAMRATLSVDVPRAGRKIPCLLSDMLKNYRVGTVALRTCALKSYLRVVRAGPGGQPGRNARCNGHRSRHGEAYDMADEHDAHPWEGDRWQGDDAERSAATLGGFGGKSRPVTLSLIH